MTTAVVWVSRTEKGQAALYIGGDSRFSWRDAGHSRWDFGTKLFTAARQPDIFGYVGHASFGIAAITQLCATINSGAIRREHLSSRRAVRYWSLLNNAFVQIPRAVTEPTTVLYCTRDGEGQSSDFTAWQLTFPESTSLCSVRRVQLSTADAIVAREFGTGASTFRCHYDRRCRGPNGKTSRAVFWALSDAIRSGRDPNSGGPPQLVVLGDKGIPKPVGILQAGQYSLLGLPLPKDQLVKHGQVDWRDEDFTMIDPTTGKARSNAQRYVRDPLPPCV